MAHDHGPAPGDVSAAAKHTGRLALALALTALYLVVELVVGVLLGSLALIADAGHMLTDTVGLAMALSAITLGRRPAGVSMTFGRYRLEVLAALGNALLLAGVAVFVLVEAAGRFADPADIPGAGLLIVGAVGLAVNLVAFWLLRAGAQESINLRGAFLEVFADMIGSAGVLVAGVITLAFGWPYADPIVGVGIGLFVLPRAWRLGRDAVAILMQKAPSRVDVVRLRDQLVALTGVYEVRDLHVWTLTSGTDVATVHLRLEPGAPAETVRTHATGLLRGEHDIQHVTVQTEAADAAEGALSI